MYFLYIDFLLNNTFIGISFLSKSLKSAYLLLYKVFNFTFSDNCFPNSPLAYIVKIVISYLLHNLFAISTNTLSAPPNC